MSFKQYLMVATASITFLSTSTFAQDPHKVLMVVSGYGEDQGKSKPGYEFDEFSKAYLVFKSNGVDVDVASPNGGSVEADRYNPKKGYNAEVLSDSSIMDKLENTLATTNVDVDSYNGVFIVGGKGAMFDLPKDKALQSLVSDIYQDNGSIAAVCHGPAALVDIKLNDGSYLVDGKAINSFTNQEEHTFGQKWMPYFDFMLEDKLVERGGKFENNEMMLSHVAVDERLITGQNPASTSEVAEALLRSMGIEPIARKVDKEEATLAMIDKVLSNDTLAEADLMKNPDQYHLPLVGMYGMFYMKSAQSDQQLQHAISLMEIGAPKISKPEFALNIVKAHQKLGNNDKAKSRLKAIMASHPDMNEASELMKTL